MDFWELPDLILRPVLGNAPTWPSGSFLGSFCGLGLEMLQNGLLGASWAHSAAQAIKYSKIDFWGLPGPILRPGLGNAPKWPSGGFLDSFFAENTIKTIVYKQKHRKHMRKVLRFTPKGGRGTLENTSKTRVLRENNVKTRGKCSGSPQREAGHP